MNRTRSLKNRMEGKSRVTGCGDLSSHGPIKTLYFYYEELIKRDLKRIHMSGCRCNERLKAKIDGSMHLAYTGLHGELEHLMIETRLTGESFECVMRECVI